MIMKTQSRNNFKPEINANATLLNRNVYREDVITSFCDIDAYKLHMAQVAYEKYPTAQAEYKFVNRSGEDLSMHMANIRTEINKLGKLHFTDSQISFFHQNVPWLKHSFIEMLRDLRLYPERQVEVYVDDNNELQIKAKGSWLAVIWYEIFILAIVSEVRNRALFPEVPHIKFREVLHKKIRNLKKILKEKGLENDFKLMEFGTRRRLSYHLQNDAIQILMAELPDNMIGTSNYHMAMEHKIPFHGTMAHEYIQSFQAFSPMLKHQQDALTTWDEVFTGNLGIALTDTINTDSFLKDFHLGLAQRFAGLRHDSGCPIEWGEKCIAHYEKLGIDPRTKKLVFTDGLDFDKAIDILLHFKGRAQIVFGIGTFLSNDLGDYEENGVQYKALSIVMKLVRMNGQPVAKISDEPIKSICECPFYQANLMTRYGIPVDMTKLIKAVENLNITAQAA
ncbi:Nicotinate phosphoribosyltransferase [Vibrio chagasii]|nr:Nicotinate phosphoribosyltransferase [Vibrio chagasii]